MNKKNGEKPCKEELIGRLQEAPLATVIEDMKACTVCHASGKKNSEECPCCHGEMIFPRNALFRRELCDFNNPEEAALLKAIALEALKS